ncbi:osteopetrosis-associated transmembrane protein 1 [Coccinella septempunctata]|uniref:osteopetrosis-associated transmembrane protein 1 n=1 Tax=Coccinella septempunctata TaxID=41139 RepID=UPI001D08BE8F|nr:osteopetrosis-associated transmembrane protein 1 [Coccinella septempunctata]
MTLNRLNLLWIMNLFLFVNSQADENCDHQLNAFATASSNFTACAIANSKPITLCEDCVETYIQVVESYQNMSLSYGGKKCIDNYVDLDRLQIVRTIYENCFDLWNRAKCNDCFKFENSNLTPKISNKTLQFDQYYVDLVKCINGTQTNSSKEICQKCLQNYMYLNSFYVSISNENDKIGVCMDIVDIMNTTRRYWSTKCCKYRRHEEYVFIGSAVGILTLTGVFYLMTLYLGEKEKPLILQQNRLAESLNHLNRDSDDISDEEE